MSDRSVYTAVNTVTKGKLATFLIDHRQAGESCETIARGVRETFGVEITGSGCYKWFRQHLPEHLDINSQGE